MSTKYYRIQQPEHPVELLLDPETQLSTNWCDADDIRHGVSVCDSIESLAEYFAQAGINLSDDCSIVTLTGNWSDEDDADGELGALLIIPTEVLDVTPVSDDFYELVGAAYDRING